MLIYVLHPEMKLSAACMQPPLLQNQARLAYHVAMRLSAERRGLHYVKGTLEYERLVDFWRQAYLELVSYGDHLCVHFTKLTDMKLGLEHTWLAGETAHEMMALRQANWGELTIQHKSSHFPWPADLNRIYPAHAVYLYNHEPRNAHTYDCVDGSKVYREADLWPGMPPLREKPEPSDFELLLRKLREEPE